MESHAVSIATETVKPALLPDTGLTNADASARLARDGYNELPTAKPRRLFAIAPDVAREPMFLLLMACGAIYLLLGDKGVAALVLILEELRKLAMAIFARLGSGAVPAKNA